MPVVPGHRLGPYEIVAPLGHGGMGEVYRARDTRLDRIVAIKILPPELAAGQQFRERFEREARVISSLSHPHICPLFDVGNQDGVDFLVMEHLEGETLAERLEKGSVPLDQALTIAIEIASALDSAHRAGIVHRDLKPANVFLTRNGARLLDFGLAKNASRAISSSAVRSGDVGPTALPTTPPASTITAQGTILGTFQYMAPEQLEGREADPRTDIFAFGCVVFEMVTGRKAFQGKTQVSLLGAILKDDPPPVSTVQPMSPAALDFVIRKCLAKDADRRWQTAADLVSQLEWIAQGGASVAPTQPARHAARAVDTRLAVASALVAALVVGGGAWLLKPSPATEPRPITRFAINLPADQNFSRPGRHSVAISRDGTKIVYVANQQLYLRALDQIEATLIRGTSIDPVNPFFSPDGQSVGFYASGELRKIAITGGAAVKLCDAINPFGAIWVDDRVIFAQGAAGILDVSAGGGTPRVLVKVDGSAGELAHGPQLLSGGEAILYTLARGQAWDEARAVVQSLKTGVRKTLLEGATDAHYVETGHLVYGHDGAILAVPFDARRLEVRGTPAVLVEGVRGSNPTGAMQFALSSVGTAAYVPDPLTLNRTLVWVDRRGTETPILSAGSRSFAQPRISPDGARVAMEIAGQDQAVWIWEFTRGTLTRLTFGRSLDLQPRWTADGRRVLYSSGYSEDRGVFWKAADGTGAAERLTRGNDARQPRSVTPDGKWMLVAGSSTTTGFDLNVVALEGDRRTQPLLRGPFNETNGEISPDGRWIAYQSDESGRLEIYVRPFPGVDMGRWQVSATGGIVPRWSRDGRELFFLDLTNMLMAVRVRADGTGLIPARPTPLFSIAGYAVAYDVAPDGRFLMIKNGAPGHAQQIIVVQNWIEELKARAGSK